MSAPRTIQCCIAGALLLQACASPPARPELVVQPNFALRHAVNETADAYYQLGRHHQGQGNLELALTGYTYAIARDARHLDARVAAAALHANAGRLDQARAMMVGVVADHPALSQAHNNLGYIDYLRGDHAGAAQSIRHALVLDRRNERARNNLQLAEAALAAQPAPDASLAARMLAAVAPAPTPTPAPAPLPLPAQALLPVVAAPAPAPLADTAAPQVALVQVVPNVYELQLAAPAAARPAPARVAQQAGAPSLRVEVSNGAGTTGLARRLSAVFRQQGVPVARLSNQRQFGQQATRIVYRDSAASQAEALRAMIDGPVLMQPVGRLQAGWDVKVIVGKDTQRAMAARKVREAPVMAQR